MSRVTPLVIITLTTDLLLAALRICITQDIVINVPVPSNTSNVNVKTTGGKCIYQPTKSCIEWSVPKLAGGQAIILKGDVELTHLIKDKQWSRPPISMQFTVNMLRMRT